MNVPLEAEMDSNQIRKRAIAFANSGDWCNPVVISESEADADIVLDRGSGDISKYRYFRIEVDMRPEKQAQLIAIATQDEQSQVKQFVNGKWTIDITCSATDVISVSFPFVD